MSSKPSSKRARSSAARPQRRAKKTERSVAASSPIPPKREIELSPLRHCVMCGSNRVARKLVTVQMRNGLEVEALEADVCPGCGEQYFDMVAMNRLEAARRTDNESPAAPHRKHKGDRSVL